MSETRTVATLAIWIMSIPVGGFLGMAAAGVRLGDPLLAAFAMFSAVVTGSFLFRWAREYLVEFGTEPDAG